MDEEQLIEDHLEQVDNIQYLDEARREKERELIEVESKLESQMETLIEEIELAWNGVTDKELEQLHNLMEDKKFRSVKSRIRSILG